MGVKLSIVLPCLNEAETIESVVRKSFYSLQHLGLSGEVIVADNGSTDGSQNLASSLGAKIVRVQEKGYGAALKSGISSACGDYVIMGDSDDSYALDDLADFVTQLDAGYDLVIGNRFMGGIEQGAMPWLHRYLGNPVLSWLGRKFYKIPIKDFHCGLRGFRREAINKLKLTTSGMEFASEMIVKAGLNNLRICEVPTTLRKDGRSRPPHLRTWRDGWRHLIFLLASSPRWLFLYPGLGLLLFGITSIFATTWLAQAVLGFKFGIATFILGVGLILSGVQIVLLSILMRIFASRHGFLPKSKSSSKLDSVFTLERGILIGLFLLFISISIFVSILFIWSEYQYGSIINEGTLKAAALVVLAFCLGLQIIFSSFFASILQV